MTPKAEGISRRTAVRATTFGFLVSQWAIFASKLYALLPYFFPKIPVMARQKS